MASRKRGGLGKTLNEILATEYGDAGKIFEQTGAEGPLVPLTPSSGGVPSPNEGPPRPRARTGGLGQSVSDILDTGGPIKPTAFETDIFRLARPEYIENIRQAEYPPDHDGPLFKIKRPDKYEKFWGQGASKSTRVQAMQWIPTKINEETGETTGDIFVAFARPSRGKSGLFYYKNKSYDTWKALSTSPSIGRSVNVILGTPASQDSMSEELYSFYRNLHPSTTTWIFDKAWMSIRVPNTVGDVDILRTKSGVGKALEARTTGITPESLRESFGE